MTRNGRPPALQTLNIPTIVIHYAEPTPGLTPRTAYFQEVDEDPDYLQIKVHLSPSAPITPVQPRIPRNKPSFRTSSRPQPKKQPNRSWRVVAWSVILALFITALLYNFNSNPRHSAPPSTFSGKPMEWVTITPKRASATPVAIPTPIIHPAVAQKLSLTPEDWDPVV